MGLRSRGESEGGRERKERRREVVAGVTRDEG